MAKHGQGITKNSSTKCCCRSKLPGFFRCNPTRRSRPRTNHPQISQIDADFCSVGICGRLRNLRIDFNEFRCKEIRRRACSRFIRVSSVSIRGQKALISGDCGSAAAGIPWLNCLLCNPCRTPKIRKTRASLLQMAKKNGNMKLRSLRAQLVQPVEPRSRTGLDGIKPGRPAEQISATLRAGWA